MNEASEEDDDDVLVEEEVVEELEELEREGEWEAGSEGVLECLRVRRRMEEKRRWTEGWKER